MAENKEIEISEFVQKYLEPFPGDLPSGTDASNTEEYFKLSMEIQKVTPDYKLCKELADIILLEKSKDLRIASWLCFILFRIDKLKGLKEGLNIIYNLLIKYQNNLYPSNEAHRSRALQFLNIPRVFRLVEKEEISPPDAKNAVEANRLLLMITDECTRLFPGNSPVLKQFQEVLSAHTRNADKLLSASLGKEEEKPAKDESVAKNVPPVPAASEEKVVVTPAGKIEDTQKIKSPEPAMPPAPVKEFKAASEKDAASQIKQMLLYFFEELQEGVKREKIPSSAFVFGISRQLQWDRLLRPPETDKITQISAPNQTIQSKIRDWFSLGDYDALIPRVEINFLKSDSEFIYWLDAQRFVTTALEKKGGIYLQSAEDIKYHLSKLVKKIPDFILMKFRDRQTPFADAETIKWIEDEVLKTHASGEKKELSALPPIIGEDYENVNRMYEEALSGLPDKFEENLRLMQQAIASEVRIKGRFLRLLNLANYCINSQKYRLSKVYLTELKKKIGDLNLTEWEPALCTAVWESLFIVNKKLLDELKEKEAKLLLEKEQDELFSGIAKYDALLALKLQINK